jgi:hypothetical protein
MLFIKKMMLCCSIKICTFSLVKSASRIENGILTVCVYKQLMITKRENTCPLSPKKKQLFSLKINK